MGAVLRRSMTRLAGCPARHCLRSVTAGLLVQGARWRTRADTMSALLWSPPVRVTVTTYAVLRLDAEALAREPWDTFVLDEA